MSSVLIIGASRGLGLEFARQYRAAGWQVTATSRDTAGAERLESLGCATLPLDVSDPAQLAAFGGRLAGARFDVAIVNAGVIGPKRDALQPPSREEFDAVMHTNVWAPMQLIPTLAEHLPSPGGRLAVLSSKMGSLATLANPGTATYRISKTAVNMVVRAASLGLAPRGIAVFALHPGWVRTDMGGTDADLSPEESIAGMRRVIAEVAEPGGFYNYDGTVLAW